MDSVTDATNEEAAGRRAENLRLLAEAGITEMLLPRAWPIELSPQAIRYWPTANNEDGLQLDRKIDEELSKLKMEFGINVYRPDMFHFVNDIWANPSAYGYPDPPGEAFHCDELHFTEKTHGILAEEFLRWLIPVLKIETQQFTETGKLILTWTGSDGPFRVEQTPNPALKNWEPIGDLTHDKHASIPLENRLGFFRIVSLGQ